MPSLSGYRDAFAFVVLVLVLLVRPFRPFRAAFGGKDMKTSMRNLLLNFAAIVGLLAPVPCLGGDQPRRLGKVQILNLIAVNCILALS